MMTVAESPQSKLRRELGLPPKSSGGRRVDDWVGFNCGDLVREREGRHIGRVVAVISGFTIRVRWLDRGWLSDLDRDDIVQVKTDAE